jgi:[ribosomal protein S5]-alanine N-acetyltransferase
MISALNQTTVRLVIKSLTSVDPQLLRSFLLSNRHAHAKWQPRRSDAYFELDRIRASFYAERSASKGANAFRVALLDPDQARVLGLINFTNIQGFPFNATNVGFAVDHKHEGLGLMSEALRVAIPFAFQSFSLNRIMANFMPSNFRSARLLSSLGFEIEGFAKDYLQIAGQWEDHILTSMTRKNWESLNGPL